VSTQTADAPTEQERPSRWRRAGRRLAVLAAVTMLALLVLVGVVWATTEVPLPGQVENPQSTVVLWSDGTEMSTVGPVNRVSVPLDRISPNARQAVLAAEDRGFYDQSGISVRGTLRALYVNVRGREVQQGGSTITQQYVRNAVLTPERTLSRKLREVAIAVKLDATTDKDEILERYLDTVYFGRGAYGIEAAAQTFFATSAADLTSEQGRCWRPCCAHRRPTTRRTRRSARRSDGATSSTGWSTRAGCRPRPTSTPTRRCCRASPAGTPSAARRATWSRWRWTRPVPWASPRSGSTRAGWSSRRRWTRGCRRPPSPPSAAPPATPCRQGCSGRWPPSSPAPAACAPSTAATTT
jgi:hypothetical protein